MKKVLFLLYLLISCISYAQTKKAATASTSRTISFDNDWLFRKDSSNHAEEINYNDATWRKLDLPHDWSIEDLPNQTPDSIIGPFSKAAVSGRDGGFLAGGTAWYRKHFTLGKTSTDKKFFIQFDGVYMNADVWINEHHLGNHPYGYTSFYYDLTPYLKSAGQENVIAVQVKNEGINSRWYSGSGIYRHVWLTTVNPTHIQTWGTYITTPAVSEKSADVLIETTVANNTQDKAPLTLLTELYTALGKLIATSKKNIAVTTVENPRKLTPKRHGKLTPVRQIKLTPCRQHKLTPCKVS